MSGVFYGVGKAINGLGKSVNNAVDSLFCANSFSAETTVVTKDGDTPIHEIEIGDYVLAWNEETAELSFERVTDTIHHTDEIIIHLTIGSEEVETTPEHPFYVEGKGWVNAEDLQVDDDIRNADGSTGEVVSITAEETSQEMYNLTVDEAHTFFVGDGQWLVHNCPVGAGVIQRYSRNLREQLQEFASQTTGGWNATWLAHAQGTGKVLVYSEGDEILGALMYTSGKSASNALYIQGLEVLPDARNRGIARLLLQEAQDISRREGFGGSMYAIVNPGQSERYEILAIFQHFGANVDVNEGIIYMDEFFSP